MLNRRWANSTHIRPNSFAGRCSNRPVVMTSPIWIFAIMELINIGFGGTCCVADFSNFKSFEILLLLSGWLFLIVAVSLNPFRYVQKFHLTESGIWRRLCGVERCIHWCDLRFVELVRHYAPSTAHGMGIREEVLVRLNAANRKLSISHEIVRFDELVARVSSECRRHHVPQFKVDMRSETLRELKRRDPVEYKRLRRQSFRVAVDQLRME